MRAPGTPRPPKAAKPDEPVIEAYVPRVPLPKLKKARHGFGEIEQGRWFEVGGKWKKVHRVGGVCGQCGQVMPGKELRLFMPPFEEQAIWTCGPCRKEARGIEAANSKPKEVVRRKVPKSKKVKNVREWLMNNGRDPLDWAGATEYSEERQTHFIELSRAMAWADEREQREAEWESEGGR